MTFSLSKPTRTETAESTSPSQFSRSPFKSAKTGLSSSVCKNH